MQIGKRRGLIEPRAGPQSPQHEKSQTGERYIGGKWYSMRSNVQYVREPDAIERLDVSVLQKYVLEPILGIRDVRTDERIGFVGGRRGTDELERMVDSGRATVAFSMFPTTMDDLFAVSDMGEIMPPKSTRARAPKSSLPAKRCKATLSRQWTTISTPPVR